ncbi:hypothetical protein [Candidatus Palauibacter sp.]|uniref:hypothetical protein n=1 Tax=Candidatus Palauibacter sp. TaxID=3101350 RepID=UPI003B5906EA
MNLRGYGPGIASFLVPGLGQLRRGRVRAAGTSLANAVLLWYATLHWFADHEFLDLVFFAMCAAVHVFQALEAMEYEQRQGPFSSRRGAPRR